MLFVVLGTITQQVLVFKWDLDHIREIVANYPIHTVYILELFVISNSKYESVLFSILF